LDISDDATLTTYGEKLEFKLLEFDERCCCGTGDEEEESDAEDGNEGEFTGDLCRVEGSLDKGDPALSVITGTMRASRDKLLKEIWVALMSVLILGSSSWGTNPSGFMLVRTIVL